MILAGTGHRPEKLGGYTAQAARDLKIVAKAHLQYLIRRDNVEIISGMAQGWDQALADACIEMGIRWTAAIPFEGQASVWPDGAKRRWERLVEKANKIVVVSEGPYAPEMMQTRNIWMVDNADGVIALWDGSVGGTKNCVKYAEKVGKPVTNLYPSYVNLTRPGLF